MKTGFRKVIVVVAAIVLALISSSFINGWYNIIPWSAGALAVGYLAANRRESYFTGAVFGYVLFLVYIVANYHGKIDTNSLVHFALFVTFFSIAGALAGCIGAYLGNLMRGNRHALH